ncbi:hypothetical protein SS50377_26761 [Spironucleus salmonicida]|uniref:S1 motif domain-containing protein n=1 Tax=Spironucleus salmonicida TaxID=348837 RepID=V6LXF8_9EUKA|nr:hypothetical protein SS50377_26761 [Spironucleus salmonicida]|eukprot:EST49230.1 Hypothetical protein SS50377_10450 [Spironucleus salmonicida]
MFPLQQQDFYPGLQILAVPLKSNNGVTEFELPSGFIGICSGEFLLDHPLPMSVVKQESTRSFLLSPVNSIDIREGLIVSGKILVKEDMGYLVEIGKGKNGFLPFSEFNSTIKGLQYVPVMVKKLSKIAQLQLWNINSDTQEESTLLSPGTKIRGSIKTFNDRVADIQCDQAQHFAFQLPFQYFRRNIQVDPAFYEGFEDVFMVLAVDYKYNKAILTCQQEYTQQSINEFCVHHKFLSGQKVLCNYGRAYLPIQPELQRLDKSQLEHLMNMFPCKTQDELQVKIERKFEKIWCYILPTQYHAYLTQKNIDVTIGDIIIPVIKPYKFYYFENLFLCDLININDVYEIDMYDFEIAKIKESLPLKLGQKLDKIYEVVVTDIEKTFIFATTSYFYEGKKHTVKLRIYKHQLEEPSRKQNLALKYKFQIVQIQYDRLGYYNVITLCPYQFQDDTLLVNDMKVGDYGSGTVSQVLQTFPYSIIQLYGDDAQCYQRLNLSQSYRFTVLYRKEGQRSSVYQSEEKLTQNQILNIYESDRSINQALVRSQLPGQSCIEGRELNCENLFYHGITAGCFIIKDSSDSIRFMLPASFLSEKQKEQLLQFEENQKLITIFEKLYIIKMFGQEPLVTIYIAPMLYKSDLPIELKQIYAGFVSIKTDITFTVTLFNGNKVHIRNIDSDEQVGMFQLIQVLIVREASKGFYMGKIPMKIVHKEELIEIFPKPEFKKIVLAKTLSINNTEDILQLINSTVFADLLVFNKTLPFPQLIVDLGSGLIGRLGIRGILHSISDQYELTQDLEYFFKSIVKQHVCKENNLFILQSGDKIDFIESQLQHLTFNQEDHKGIQVLDLQLKGTSINSTDFIVIYKDTKIAICEFVQSPKPQLVIFSMADQNVINNGNQLELGKIYKNMLDKSKIIDFNTELIISKLILLKIPQSVLLFEYVYSFYEIQELMVDDQLIQTPYPHYKAIASASRLNTYSKVEVQIPLCAFDANHRFYYDISDNQVAKTDIFIPREIYEIIPGTVLKGVITGFSDGKLRVSCCGLAPAKVKTQAQLQKYEFVDFIVEGYENNTIIGSSLIGDMKEKSSIKEGNVLKCKMFAMQNGEVLAQLVDVFPSTTCYIRTDQYIRNKIVNVKIVSMKQMIIGEIEQVVQAQKQQNNFENTSFLKFTFYQIQQDNLLITPPKYKSAQQYKKALDRYNYDSGTWLAYADFYCQDIDEAFKILLQGIDSNKLKDQEYINVANAYLQIVFNEKNENFKDELTKVVAKCDSLQLFGQLSIALQEHGNEVLAMYDNQDCIQFKIQQCYYSYYQGNCIDTHSLEMEIQQQCEDKQIWSFREQIARIYYQTGQFQNGKALFEKYAKISPVSYLLSYIKLEQYNISIENARKLFADLLSRSYQAKEFKIKKVLLQKYDEFEKQCE